MVILKRVLLGLLFLFASSGISWVMYLYGSYKLGKDVSLLSIGIGIIIYLISLFSINKSGLGVSFVENNTFNNIISLIQIVLIFIGLIGFRSMLSTIDLKFINANYLEYLIVGLIILFFMINFTNSSARR